jgi:hypothetical protein
MLTPEDKDLLVKKGISEQQIAEQLACFEKGFPFLKLDAAASVEKGIMAPAISKNDANKVEILLFINRKFNINNSVNYISINPFSQSRLYEND